MIEYDYWYDMYVDEFDGLTEEKILDYLKKQER